jgi:hypothetical protein
MDPNGRLGLGRSQVGRPIRHRDELPVDGQLPPQEVDAVDGQPEGFALTRDSAVQLRTPLNNDQHVTPEMEWAPRSGAPTTHIGTMRAVQLRELVRRQGGSFDGRARCGRFWVGWWR